MADVSEFQNCMPVDPRMFCPERNFLAGGNTRWLVEVPSAPRAGRCAATDLLRKVAADYAEPVVTFGVTKAASSGTVTTNNLHVSWPVTDLEDQRCCAAIAEALPAAGPVLLIIEDLIHRLADPRPFLAMLRGVLQVHSGRRCLISTPDRLGIIEPDFGAARLWSADEFCVAMRHAGFTVKPLAVEFADDFANTMIWDLRCDAGSYLQLLSAAGLPAPFTRLLIGPRDWRPSDISAPEPVAETFRPCAADSINLSVFCGETEPDSVLASVLQILFIYPGITVIEMSDHLGIGYRVAQARRAGMLPPRTNVWTHACENSLSLNAALRGFNRDRPPRLAAMERFSIELADLAVFPDEQRCTLYVDGGGMMPRASCVGPVTRTRGMPDAMSGSVSARMGGVTILMTSFNAKKDHLADAAQGLRHAFRRPHEIIFVDDHSESESRFDPFQADELNDVPVQMMRLPENLGPAGARNAGLARVMTPYVCGHDHDNIMRNRFLSVACRILDENQDVAAVTSWMGVFDDGDDWRVTQDRSREYRPLGADLGVALTDNVIGDYFAVYRTSALREIGGWDGNGRAMWEDWQLFCRLIASGFTIWTIPDVMVLYRMRADSRSATGSHFDGWLSLTRALPGLPRGQAVSVLQAAWHNVPGPPVPAAVEPGADGLAEEVVRLRAETAELRIIASSTAWRQLRRVLTWLEQVPVFLRFFRAIAAPRRQAVTAAPPPIPTAQSAPRVTVQRDAAPDRRPLVSIIIPTDRRPESLDNLLTCLRYQDGPDFEVIVVTGPSGMGTDAVVEKWSNVIKVARTAVHNTSRSRNLGIAMAAGDIIALIDDDALPEADWLAALTACFSDPAVGGAGGAEYDHTGMLCGTPFISVDRLGHMDRSWTAPVDAFNVPMSYNIPFTAGVNSAFRHAALRAVGGFDEEYEYYYDETDLCCRLLDAGWQLRQVSGAVVHHKKRASHIRSETLIYHSIFSMMKGKLYFSLVNNHGHYSTERAVEDMQVYVAAHEAQLKSHVAAGQLEASVLEQFAADAERAWREGLELGTAKRRRLAGWAGTNWRRDTFLAFSRPCPAGGRLVILLVRFSPDEDGVVLNRAGGWAAAGHHVHAVLPAQHQDRVDFESGVWVYRFSTPLLAVRRVTARWKVNFVYVAKGETPDADAAAAEMARALDRAARPDSMPGWFCITLNDVKGESIGAE